MTLTHIDLFAGILGFSLGFSRAGIETIACVENDPHCQKVIRRHLPDVLLLGDIRECGKHNLPHADIITFGSPCQDLSVAGKRKGLEGERSGLFYEAIRIVDELKPTIAVWENVPGAFSSNRGRDFGAVLLAFQDIGARDIAWTVLDAQYFGVPQRRRRIFLIADFGGERSAKILFESESLSWNPEESRKERKESSRIAGTLPASGSGLDRPSRSGNQLDFCIPVGVIKGASIGRKPEVGPQRGEFLNDGTCYTISTNETHAVAFQQNTRDEVRLMGGDGEIVGALSSEAGMKQQNYIAPSVTSKWAKQSGGPSGNETGNLVVHQPLTGHGYRGSPDDGMMVAVAENQRGEVRITDYANSVSSGGGKPGQGYQATFDSFGVRRLTPTECERLQGFTEIEEKITIDVWLDHQKNCASAEIQSHKLPKHVGSAGRTELLGSVRFAESHLSTRNQPGVKPVLPSVLIYCGEREAEIRNQEKLRLYVNFAERESQFPPFTRNEDFALLLVGASSILGQIVQHGVEELPQNAPKLIIQRGGQSVVRLFGNEIMRLVSGVGKDLITNKKLLKSIISSPLSIEISDMTLTTLFYFVLDAISGYIPKEILKSNSFQVEINTSFGHTFGLSDTVRYRMLGNAVCVPVVEYIGRRIVEALK